jgi:hypothetical protein
MRPACAVLAAIVNTPAAMAAVRTDNFFIRSYTNLAVGMYSHGRASSRLEHLAKDIRNLLGLRFEC